MKTIDFDNFDEPVFTEMCQVLLAAASDEVREVAERSPGLYVKPLEGDEALLYLIDNDEDVPVGTFELSAVRRTPPPPQIDVLAR
jgi:hypothetical protein